MAQINQIWVQKKALLALFNSEIRMRLAFESNTNRMRLVFFLKKVFKKKKKTKF